MRRRHVIAALGSVALSRSGPVHAQSRARPTIGVLWHAGSPEQEGDYLPVLLSAFRDLDYVEGKTARFEHRFPAEKPELFERFAKELVDLRVDIIVAVTGLGAVQAKRFTNSIPIVFVVVPDPLRIGLVSSLARPEGNATGLSLMGTDLAGKRLELLRTAVGHLSRLGVIMDAAEPASRGFFAGIQAAAALLGMSVTSREIRSPDDIDRAVSELAREPVQAVFVGPSPLLYNERAILGGAVVKNQLPLMVNIAEMVPFGAVMSYGPDFPEFFRRAAMYADRILRGTSPSDLPVEQPTRLKFVINLKAASAIGLNIPHTILTQADEVLE
jgi:putative ABC transport system substrate-binding protein